MSLWEWVHTIDPLTRIKYVTYHKPGIKKRRQFATLSKMRSQMQRVARNANSEPHSIPKSGTRMGSSRWHYQGVRIRRRLTAADHSNGEILKVHTDHGMRNPKSLTATFAQRLRSRHVLLSFMRVNDGKSGNCRSELSSHARKVNGNTRI